MLQVTLYTKDRCGLCVEAKAMLRRLASRYPHALREVDITQEPELFARYHLIIPVVEIGAVRLHAPLDAQALEAALAKAMGGKSL